MHSTHSHFSQFLVYRSLERTWNKKKKYELTDLFMKK